MSQPNQFTKAEEEGRERPKAENHFTTGKRSKQDEATKDRIRAELLAQRLHAFVTGTKDEHGRNVELSPAQVSAAKVLIDKGKPSLQAVEQQQVNEWDKMDEEEVLEMVKALITANPGLIQRLGIGLRAVDAAPQEGNESKVA